MGTPDTNTPANAHAQSVRLVIAYEFPLDVEGTVSKEDRELLEESLLTFIERDQAAPYRVLKRSLWTVMKGGPAQWKKKDSKHKSSSNSR